MRKVYSHSQLSTKNRKDQRRRRNSENKKKTRTTFPIADGFLKQTFSPITPLGEPSSMEAIQTTDQILRSLDYLHRLHQLPAVQLPPLPYPKNLDHAFEASTKWLTKQQPSLHLELMQNNEGKRFVATIQELDINMTLFYLPLKSPWELHQQKNRGAFQLLLGIYSYLYHCAGMTSFQSGNYVWDACECIKEYMVSDEGDFDKEELRAITEEFTLLRRVSPILNQAIRDILPFNQLPKHIDECDAITSFDANLKKIAIQLLELHIAHPNEVFTQNLSSRWLYEQEEEPTYVEQYFSFCWSGKGWLMEQLEYHVNNDLQERSFLDVPCSVQLFDQPHTQINHQLLYHEKLMELLNELLELLNDQL